MWEWQDLGLWASTHIPFTPELVTLSHLPPTSPAAAGPQDPGPGRGQKWQEGRRAESTPLSFLVCCSPPFLRHPPLCLMEPTRGIDLPPFLFRGPAGQGWGAAWRRSHRLGFPLCGGGWG